DARILRDWETWMQEKTTILVRRDVRNTNLNLHEEINTLSLSKDGSSAKNMKSNPDLDTSEDQEEKDQEEEDNDIGNINFMERIEEFKPMSSTCQRPWVLRSGTNVGDKLTSYIKTIPEAQKCLK
ncbi:5334_t:CDS:2, partial [Paraglomus brasilianum]